MAIGLTAGIVAGFAIGTAAGVATGQFPLWIGCIGYPIGAGLGSLIGLAFSRVKL